MTQRGACFHPRLVAVAGVIVFAGLLSSMSLPIVLRMCSPELAARLSLLRNQHLFVRFSPTDESFGWIAVGDRPSFGYLPALLRSTTLDPWGEGYYAYRQPMDRDYRFYSAGPNEVDEGGAGDDVAFTSLERLDPRLAALIWLARAPVAIGLIAAWHMLVPLRSPRMRPWAEWIHILVAAAGSTTVASIAAMAADGEVRRLGVVFELRSRTLGLGSTGIAVCLSFAFAFFLLSIALRLHRRAGMADSMFPTSE